LRHRRPPFIASAAGLSGASRISSQSGGRVRSRGGNCAHHNRKEAVMNQEFTPVILIHL
jgi:hypothetical protein